MSPTICGPPTRRKIPSCSTTWPSNWSANKYDLKHVFRLILNSKRTVVEYREPEQQGRCESFLSLLRAAFGGGAASGRDRPGDADVGDVCRLRSRAADAFAPGPARARFRTPIFVRGSWSYLVAPRETGASRAKEPASLRCGRPCTASLGRNARPGFQKSARAARISAEQQSPTEEVMEEDAP